MADFDYQELVKAAEGFSPSRLVGKGSHGSVYKGIFLEENKILAIKKCSSIRHDHVSYDNSRKLDNEISVLSSLRPSPYIVNFLGTSHYHHHDLVSNKMIQYKLLVMEFLPNGSLQDLLHVAETPPSWSKRVEIAIQIARAIQFLHEGKPLVIHRDIKSSNVLFDSKWNAKLADYGLSVSPRIDSSSYRTSQPAGTIGYMDPYYTTPSKLSTKNDVFSYGVVLLEIISSRKAIDVNRSTASIVEWAIPLIQKEKLMEICDARVGFPPPFIEGMIRHLLYMAARCVSCNQENRPSIGDVVMGMDNSFIERARPVPSRSWIALIKSLLVMRRQKRLAKRCVHKKFEDYSDISKGKVLLREILADFTLK